MSDKPFDAFTDQRYGQAGIFGSGLDDTEKVDASLDPSGLILEMRCTGCGYGTQLTLEWAELICLSFGFSPKVLYDNPQIAGQLRGTLAGQPTHWIWKRHEDTPHGGVRANKWALEQACPKCSGDKRFKLAVRMDKNEPRAHLQRARHNSYVPPQLDAQVAAVCNRLRQQLQASRQQQRR